MNHPVPFHRPSDVLVHGDLDFDRNIRPRMPQRLGPNEKRLLSTGMRVVLDMTLAVHAYLGIFIKQPTGLIAHPGDCLC